MPPSASAAYARGHDDAIWATLQTMLGGVGDREAVQARLLAALPGALGGLGLQSAQLTAPAASPGRTHCPPYTHACPGARLVTSSFSKPSWGKPRTASGKRRMLVVSCWTGVGATAPRGVRSWKALAPPSQRTPAQETGRTVGNTMLFGPSPNTLANVWSCRPCRPVPVRCFALRRRLRLALTGLLARRGKIVERAWVRVAREAVGAEDVASDFDLVVYGATAHGGVLCCDATFVSPLTRTGHPQPCSVEVDGAMLKVAERRKRSTYPELARGPQRLLVLGSEIGGRRQPPAGRDAGGALFPSRSSSPSPVPRLAAMASWSTAGAK
ncbi:hypothetical protein AK812_SmicGene26092 [Symbiodinium microadriaticum]|uniref:Uncharacterized protein n=1 Tax=Symbiodinium microadriaticum TaxID=2951 RepID=A0A1Q9DAF9_SYMMI|nr:hypothetical protein AK812_SmicGene26092 [Symbiodinium microadriaticum]